MITHYHPYVDHCKEHHPRYDPYRCASVYIFLKPLQQYDDIDGQFHYGDFNDEAKTFDRFDESRLLSKQLLYFGFLLYLLEYKVHKNFMLMFVFSFSLFFYLRDIDMWAPKFGIDTTAYLNQAAQFVHGQNYYPNITSLQGPCYYPAGHLWHYAPIYMMFQ